MTALYHILNRGVEKREIFLDNQDRARFIHDMYEFNDRGPANNTLRHMNDLRSRSLVVGHLVEIHGWCVMGNHYHILVSEVVEGGLSTFLRKLNIGYAKYFNERYKRSGTLFQGRTKKILIEQEAHFLHILHYIHLNPLDFLKGAHVWREGNISDARQALEHLEKYRWSSYLDYCGKKNFPSILTRGLFDDVFSNYGKEIRSYLHDIDVSKISGLKLE